MQSFFMFFYVLDQIFDRCKEDDLGGFLGAISPEFCEDARPIDKAIVKQWMEFNDVGAVNKENIIQRTYEFLNYYEERFGYNFRYAKIELLNNMENEELVDRVYELSQLMFEKFLMHQ